MSRRDGATPDHQDATEAVVGLTVEAATKLFAEKYPNFTLHVTWQDNLSYGGEKNIDDDRLNVGVQDGIILAKWNQNSRLWWG